MPKLLTRDELCANYRISRPTEQALRTREEDPLPSMRIGRQLRYKPSEVEDWMRRQAAPPKARRA